MTKIINEICSCDCCEKAINNSPRLTYLDLKNEQYCGAWQMWVIHFSDGDNDELDGCEKFSEFVLCEHKTLMAHDHHDIWYVFDSLRWKKWNTYV